MAIKTQGITVTYENGAAAAQTVGGVVSVQYGGGQVTEIDTTTLADTQKTFLPGLADRGNVTIELVADYDDVGQVAMLDAMETQATREMIIIRPSGTLVTDTFQVFVTSLENNGTVDDKVMVTMTGKISGAIVRT